VTEQRLQRRLAAILAADVVGYSALMQRAEEATYAEFERLKRELIEPSLSRHEGRLVKTTGDGALVEFASPLAAVRCAVEIQDHLASGSSPFRLRVGLNLGDVIVGQDGELYGDGINIAVRLEGIADPGGILISEKVYGEVEGKLAVGFEDRGEQQLKNISKPVRAYAVYAATFSALTEKPSAAPPLPDKPSIAVLPFENMSGDPEQEYFADGMVEEITTALSRFKWLFVIARNSSFTFKGKAVDVKEIGRRLAVRYVLEGSVRKAGDRVRIAGQLIDVSTAAHLWADRFDGRLEDIFELQDQVTSSVVGAIFPKLQQAEIERARRKPTENLDAYDYYLRGMAAYDVPGRWENRDGNDDALRLFWKAIELDPDFSAAYAMAAMCFMRRKSNGWMLRLEQETAQAGQLASQAARLGQDDADALSRAGFVLARVVGDLDAGAALIDRALQLNPNLASGWLHSGITKNLLGEPDIAITHFARATRLNPLGPYVVHAQMGTALAHFLAGHRNEARLWAKKALEHRPDFLNALRLLAASSALSGRTEEAEKIMQQLLQLNPTLRISNLKDVYPFRRPEDLASLIEGLRKAGLPE
jgi:adenylate cyclase